MGQEIVANLRPLVDHHVRMQHRVAANCDIVSHHRKSPDGCPLANARGFRHRCERVNPRRGFRRLIEKLECPREIEIRIRRNQAGNRKVAHRLGG